MSVLFNFDMFVIALTKTRECRMKVSLSNAWPYVVIDELL